MNKIKHVFIILVFITSLMITSCGTLYKKPFVTTTSNVDYYVVFLDSLGLLFFVIPGVIALTVDYATGTLFLTEEQEKARNYPLNPEAVRSLIVYNKENSTSLN